MSDTECALTLTVDEHGWDLCRCDCGWISPPCPDTETAVEFWGDHIRPSGCVPMPDPRPIPPVPSDWTAPPEGLSREDEYVVAGAAQTLDGDPPFSEAALLAVGCDLLAIVRRLTKEPK